MNTTPGQTACFNSMFPFMASGIQREMVPVFRTAVRPGGMGANTRRILPRRHPLPLEKRSFEVRMVGSAGDVIGGWACTL